MTKKSNPALGVRLPPQLIQRIDESAQKNLRSRNSEIVFRLTESFEKQIDVMPKVANG